MLSVSVQMQMIASMLWVSSAESAHTASTDAAHYASRLIVGLHSTNGASSMAVAQHKQMERSVAAGHLHHGDGCCHSVANANDDQDHILDSASKCHLAWPCQNQATTVNCQLTLRVWIQNKKMSLICFTYLQKLTQEAFDACHVRPVPSASVRAWVPAHALESLLCSLASLHEALPSDSNDKVDLHLAFVCR